MTDEKEEEGGGVEECDNWEDSRLAKSLKTVVCATVRRHSLDQ